MQCTWLVWVPTAQCNAVSIFTRADVTYNLKARAERWADSTHFDAPRCQTEAAWGVSMTKKSAQNENPASDRRWYARSLYFRDDTRSVNPYESSGLVTNFHRLTPGVSEYCLHLVHGKQSYTILGVNSNLIECQKVDLPIWATKGVTMTPLFFIRIYYALSVSLFLTFSKIVLKRCRICSSPSFSISNFNFQLSFLYQILLIFVYYRLRTRRTINLFNDGENQKGAITTDFVYSDIHTQKFLRNDYTATSILPDGMYAW